MTRLEQLEKLLDLVDEASELVRQLPEDDKLRIHSQELEGFSNGGFIYDEEDGDYFYLRDHVNMAILKEKGQLPADCDPESV
jgi:hypothetical protein